MAEHTPTPWTYRDASGAGLEICAPVYRMTGVDLPHGMPGAPIHVFQFTAPQIVQIAAERWVQFEPTGWSEMQAANAAFIVKAVNNHDALIEALHEARMALFKIRACSIVGCEQGYGKPELWADALFASHGDVAKALKTIDAALTQPASAVGALPPRASSQPAESAGAKTGGGK